MEPADFPVARVPRDQEVAQKRTLRHALRARLQALPPDLLAAKSALIRQRLQASPHWPNAHRIAFFAAHGPEPDLAPLAAAARAAGARTFYPCIDRDRLTFHEIHTSADLRPGAFGLLEPAADPATLLPPAQLDLLLIPGLAFTPTAERLGRGGGFYDRVCAATIGWKIGIAFAEQLLPTLPLEPHDQRLDELITDASAPAETAAETE